MGTDRPNPGLVGQAARLGAGRAGRVGGPVGRGVQALASRDDRRARKEQRQQKTRAVKR